MRKIEQAMNTAILNYQNWRKDNTEVVYDSAKGESTVKLHGNTIAVIGEGFVQVFDGGWQSNTTKSRLNAILNDHSNGDRVFQKDYQWMIEYNGNVEPFISGMILV